MGARDSAGHEQAESNPGAGAGETGPEQSLSVARAEFRFAPPDPYGYTPSARARRKVDRAFPTPPRGGSNHRPHRHSDSIRVAESDGPAHPQLDLRLIRIAPKLLDGALQQLGQLDP